MDFEVNISNPVDISFYVFHTWQQNCLKNELTEEWERYNTGCFKREDLSYERLRGRTIYIYVYITPTKYGCICNPYYIYMYM